LDKVKMNTTSLC